MNPGDRIWVGERAYNLLRPLGHGQGGYSYLVDDEAGRQVVVKQIHHEPCSYYTFGDKLAAERHDYDRLRAAGIPVPELYAVDRAAERLVKAYIDGPTVFDLVLAPYTGGTENQIATQTGNVDCFLHITVQKDAIANTGSVKTFEEGSIAVTGGTLNANGAVSSAAF